MKINKIKNGIAIDHIRPSRGMAVLEALEIDVKHETLGLIMNTVSEKTGSKDLIVIENRTDINMDVLGVIEPCATVNIIEDGAVARKIHLELPQRIENILYCKNPRCITAAEGGLPHVFELIDREKQEYRCIYCDEIRTV